MERRTRSHAMAFAFLCLSAAPLCAASGTTASTAPSPVRRVTAAAHGQLIEVSGVANRAEVVRFGDAVTPGLLATPPEQSVHVAGWPVAPGERADVVLTRHEIYAPDAKIYRVENGKTAEVPHSRLVFLWGEAENDPGVRVFAAVDPDSAQLDGFAASPRATHEIHPLGNAKLGAAVPGVLQYLVAPPEVFLEQAGERPEWTCGQSGVPLDFLLNQKTAPHSGITGTPGTSSSLFDSVNAITTLHNAVLAIDTDNELLFNKFADNTTSAANFVASLIAQMNVIYNRDLLIQLVQGTTFLRVGNSSDGDHFNDDPWTQPGTGGANPNQLNEVSNYWSSTNGGITRAFVAMLSGKGSSNGASGIAWVPSALCNHSTGVSFSQVFLAGTAPSFGDVLVVAHEIGHNFGSPHTHCYSPPIDSCYNGEASQGCYAGTPSCPAASTINGVPNVQGTLMSYCHLLGGCSSSLVFHPRTVTLVQPLIQAAVNTCIFPAATPVGVSAISPNSGKTGGGTAVTLTGSSFVNGATVSLGGSPATSVVVSSATRITAVTPAHATGKVNVVVTNPDSSNATLTNGFFYAPPPAQSDLYTISPCRLLDTRNATGPLGGPALGAMAQRTFTAAGHCGIPSTARAIAVNITSVNPAAAGFLATFPGNAFPLGTTDVSFQPLTVRANNALICLATDSTGSFGIQNGSTGTTNVVVDVVGYFN